VDYASFDACYDVRDSEEASSSELSSNDRPSSAADNSRQRSAEEDVESTGVHHHSSFLKNATVVPPVSLPLLPIDDVVRAVPRMMAVATMTRQPNNKDDAERGVFAYKVDSDSGASATTTIMIPSEFHSVTLAPKKQTPPSDGNLATKPSSQRRRLKPINKHRKVVDSDQVKAAMRQRQMKEKQKPVNPDGQIRIKVTRSSRSQNTENVNDDAREDSIMRLMPPNDEIRS
jgi:hypothetical protein